MHRKLGGITLDEDINVRDWKDVVWAITTRMDPSRETQREWGRTMQMAPEVTARVEAIWQSLIF